MKHKYKLSAICILIFLGGCASRELTPIFRPVDIGYSGLPREYNDGKKTSLNGVNLPDLINKGSSDLDDAFRLFRSRCLTGDGCRFERNSIQDRLIAASNSICIDYKSSLKQAQANTNLNFGGASTILGGLGAIAQSASPARLYSGAAAMASGLRAEVNQNIYAMLAVEVITKAIDKSRSEALREIESSQLKVVSNYTLERAVSDAVEYHGRCTILAGLQEAATAVSQSENIGIKTLGQTLSDLGQSTTVQLGKKQYNIGGTDTVLMHTVCISVKQQYDAFVLDKKIDLAKFDFVESRDNWSKIFSDVNYCKNLDQSGDVAAEFDKRWQALVAEFVTQTDDKERDRVIGQIAGQQAGAKAVAGALVAALETTKNGMQSAIGRIASAKDAVQKAIAISPVSALESSATDATAITQARESLVKIQTAMKDVMEKIKSTKSNLDNSAETSINSLVSAIDKLKSDTDITGINNVINLQGNAFDAIKGWSPK